MPLNSPMGAAGVGPGGEVELGGPPASRDSLSRWLAERNGQYTKHPSDFIFPPRPRDVTGSAAIGVSHSFRGVSGFRKRGSVQRGVVVRARCRAETKSVDLLGYSPINSAAGGMREMSTARGYLLFGYLRSPQLIQCDAKRRAGDLDYPPIGLIHLEHHEDRAGKCESGNEQCRYHAGVSGRVESEAGEDNR